MFEYKLQESWQNYRYDFGLGRNCLFVSFFNLFIFLYSLIYLGSFRLLLLLPFVLSMSLALFNKSIKELSLTKTFILNILFLAFIIPFNYSLTGIVDSDAHALIRYDEFFARVDVILLGATSSANLFYETFGKAFYSKALYSWLQLSYLSFYIFPFYLGIVYYLKLENRSKFLIGRLLSSITIFFSINYFLYLVVPVTGPQYFMPSEFQFDLPLYGFAAYINSSIRAGQPTYIDCFPSGHMGVSLLCTLWFARMKSRHFFVSLFLTISIGVATIALRYHYLLDLISAVPLVLFCYKVSTQVIPVPVFRRRR
ncbi:hypothetical protein BIY24_06950 [Halobacteriovorax marinus]|uniref:phosphatase PAP2 family protein n=1 Tax=Halobacteriovorax marinus TaxID=97084 RepID=UPI000BC35752|nr:phosphatase PAP2 family protein [Halobacteriovorax marinus]ATH07692.1 hypothetical protein BIY24_06950 [Halobacteriovorax marinus]